MRRVSLVGGGVLALLCFVFALAAPLSAAPQSAPVAQTTPTSATGTVTGGANLRAGPGATFSRVGSAAAGQRVTITGSQVNSAEELWYQLSDGSWIAGFLVTGVTTAQAPTATPIPRRFSTVGLTPATVIGIVDGDTIDVSIAGVIFRLRYIGMDTPERGDNFFAEATAANRVLVGGKVVYLEKDISNVDRYDRLLRYVYLADGTFVNRELVRQGYAVASTYLPDVKYQDSLRLAQQEAVAVGVGMWASQAGATRATGATASGNANLRGGPGTNYPVIGSVGQGQALDIVARNPAGDWLQLSNGAWIFASLVSGAPDGLSVAPNIPAPPTATPVPRQVAPPAQAQPSQPQPAPQAQSGNCDPSYPTVCIPPYPPDLDCGEIPYRRFQVIGADRHGFDGDNDGIGCER